MTTYLFDDAGGEEILKPSWGDSGVDEVTAGVQRAQFYLTARRGEHFIDDRGAALGLGIVGRGPDADIARMRSSAGS